MNKISSEIYNAIKKTLRARDQYHLHEPTFSNNERLNLIKSIESTMISTAGKEVDLFRKKLKKYLNAKDVFLCNSGTSALHLALLALNVNLGDEVLIPGYSFVATANAISYVNANPHFIDVEKNSLGIDPLKLKKRLKLIATIKDGVCYNKITNKRIAAIIPVHVFGHPCRIDEIISVAKTFKIKVIEDAAESIGSIFKKKHSGTYADLGIMSFNGNKTITTGAGGAVIINNIKYRKIIEHLGTTSKIPHKWEYIHDKVGYNYKMSGLHAAVGLAQLSKINTIISQKRKLYKKYYENFKKINNIQILNEPKNCKSNYWLNTIILDRNTDKNKRDFILNFLYKKKIFARPIWRPLYKLKMYKKCQKGDLEVCNDLEFRIINIPSSSHLI